MSDNDKWEDTRNTVNYTSKNIFGILGIIFAFLCSPVGLVLSIIGKSKAVQDNDPAGAKLCKIGMILSIVFMVIEFIVFVAVFAVACSAQKEAFDFVDRTIDTIKIGM